MSERLSPDAFVERVGAEAAAVPEGERRLFALAGPPGAGKSTLADAIEGLDGVAVLAMDGFHFDDEILVPRGWRPHKGAPHTFDVGGLKATLARLKANEEDEVAVPRFDRSIEIARAGARLIPRDVALVLVEGNYLLLDEEPWDGLADLFDLTAMLCPDEETLRARLTRRWTEHGMSAEAMRPQIDDNDLPNGRFVLSRSRPADIAIV